MSDALPRTWRGWIACSAPDPTSMPTSPRGSRSWAPAARGAALRLMAHPDRILFGTDESRRGGDLHDALPVPGDRRRGTSPTAATRMRSRPRDGGPSPGSNYPRTCFGPCTETTRAACCICRADALSARAPRVRPARGRARVVRGRWVSPWRPSSRSSRSTCSGVGFRERDRVGDRRDGGRADRVPTRCGATRPTRAWAASPRSS